VQVVIIQWGIEKPASVAGTAAAALKYINSREKMVEQAMFGRRGSASLGRELPYRTPVVE
jgi:hypothetical protein